MSSKLSESSSASPGWACASHEWWLCRSFYATARANGAPSVGITDMGGGYLLAQTSDGLVTKTEMIGCCRWAMKYAAALEWLETRKPN